MKVIVVTAAETAPDNGIINHLDNSAVEAIEEGLKLKRSGQADELLVSCVGSKFSSNTVTNLFRQGVDRCHHSPCDRSPSTMEVAETLESLICQEEPDLLLIGRPPGDLTGQLGQMLAEFIEFRAVGVDQNTDTQPRLLIIREIGSGMHTVEMPVKAFNQQASTPLMATA